MQGQQQMDAKRAEAIASALLKPDLCAQEERAQRRAAWEREQARKRTAASFALIGVVAGAGLAVSQGRQIGTGALWGGLAGSAVGWLLGYLREYVWAR